MAYKRNMENMAQNMNMKYEYTGQNWNTLYDLDDEYMSQNEYYEIRKLVEGGKDKF